MATFNAIRDGADRLEPLEIPSIDVAPLAGTDVAAKMAIARQIDAACRDHGFFYVVNHGIDLAALQQVTLQFHKTLSDGEKFRIAIHAYNPANSRSRSGYYLAIKDKKANESFCYLTSCFDESHPRIQARTPLHEVNIWPDEVDGQGWRTFYEGYYRDVFALSGRLLRAFALALGEPENFFESYLRLEDTLSAVSLIRYPYLECYPSLKIAPDGTKLSFEHHQDVSLITVLYQTPVPNLQALTADGYRDIPTAENAFLVNCGTYMAYLTNGHYPAPIHRVAFINRERLSIPFFVNLGYDDVLAPLSTHGSARRPARAMRYGDYLRDGLRDLITANGQT